MVHGVQELKKTNSGPLSVTVANDHFDPRTLEPVNVFILLNGWICMHDVLD